MKIPLTFQPPRTPSTNRFELAPILPALTEGNVIVIDQHPLLVRHDVGIPVSKRPIVEERVVRGRTVAVTLLNLVRVVPLESVTCQVLYGEDGLEGVVLAIGVVAIAVYAFGPSVVISGTIQTIEWPQQILIPRVSGDEKVLDSRRNHCPFPARSAASSCQRSRRKQ